MAVKQLSVTGLKQKIDQGDKVFLLDVREPHEFRYAQIAGSVLAPLNQLPARSSELDKDQEIIVICHHGMRSQQAAHYLDHAGFSQVTNLVGGIDAWSCQCDGSVPRY